jgi:competence protein ComEA
MPDPPDLLRPPLSRSAPGAGRHRAAIPALAAASLSALAVPVRGRRLSPTRLSAAVADRLPDSLRTARLTPGRRAVVGLLVLILVIGAVLGVRLALASAAARPVAVSTAGSGPAASGAPVASAPSSTASAAAAAAAGASAAAPTASADPTASALIVYVVGRVRHPGVVTLVAGARVQDALRAAGGALPGSDLVGINLAQLLSDGEQVVVARPGQGSNVNGGSTGGGGAPGGASSGGSGGSVQVSLNSGDVTALDSLPGVGPVLAQRILDWRAAHGHFSSIDELDEVSGIGDKLMAEIRPHVRL